MKGIADTGFVVAFANRRDRHHAWATALAQEISEPLLTCDAVVAESVFHLQSAELVLSFIREGLIRPVFTLSQGFARVHELACRYRDRQPDLADLCLICLSEDYPLYPVITVDETDFRIYRRHRRQTISLITPSK